MRNTLITSLALAAMVSTSSAVVSVTGTNLDLAGSNAIPITDNTGAILGAGLNAASWGVGNFDAIDFGTATPGEILSAFNANGPVDGGFHAAFQGAFQSVRQGGTSTDGSDSFTGSNIFIMIGNGATMAASTDFIVYDSGVAWPLDPSGATGATATTFGGSLLYGVPTTVSGGSGAMTQFNGGAGVTFGRIPEPSSSLLFGAAGLALLIRRKR